MNFFSLAKRINRPLILDGAMGSMLQNMSVKSEGSLWMSFANIKSPDKVFEVHKKYIEAGADIITTNTFRTNPHAVKYFSKIDSQRLIKEGVALAVQAKGNFPVFIAGSNAPAEDCYQTERTISQKELRENHQAHINLLMNAGCDFILNETQSHFDEIKIICKHCYKEEIPFVVSFFFNNEMKLLSGENLFDVVNFVIDYQPIAIGFNCIMPDTFREASSKISGKYNWGFYLNCGKGDFRDENIKCGVLPDEYLAYVKTYLKKEPSFIGSCCGSSPQHIKKIRRFLDGRIKS